MSNLKGLALAIVCVGCASTKVKQPVRSVGVEGNQAFGDKTIVSRLATRPPTGLILKTSEEFDPIALELDRKRVESFYHERGYFDAHVTDVDVQKDGKGVKVKITVEEGEPTRLAEVDVTGSQTDFARGVLKRRAPDLVPGKILDHPEYLLAKDRVQQALVRKGYAHADVKGTVEVDREQHRAEVHLDVDPGPLVHFGKVKVEGLARVPESAVLDRIAFEEGDVFSPQVLNKTEGRLYALGLFSSVRADWEREGRPAVTDITVRITEGSRHELRFGFGAGIDRARWELRTRGGYTQHGIFDSALTTLRLDATPGWSFLRTAGGTSGPSIEASANLSRDDIFGIGRLQGNALVAYERAPRQGYILSGPRANLSLARPFIDDDLNVSVGWEIQLLSFVDADPMVFDGEAIEARLAYFEQRVVFDRRDKPLDAHKGYYAMLTVDEGGPYAGGKVGFLKTQGELRAYLPITPRLTLAGRAGAGKLGAFDGGETPLTMRFYGGGGNDHRGFSYQRLAPQRRDTEGNAIPIGGSEMVLVSGETRFDITKLWKQWLSAAIFVDGGDVTEPHMMKFGNLHWAAGFGFRYDTVIGPVRADIGFRLNRTAVSGPQGLDNPDPDEKYAFHISLGEAF